MWVIVSVDEWMDYGHWHFTAIYFREWFITYTFVPIQRYGGGSFSFSNLINGVTKRFSSEFELQQVCQFIRLIVLECYYSFPSHITQTRWSVYCTYCKHNVFYLLWQLKQFKADNAEVGFGSGTLAVEQSIERTNANIKWLAENKLDVLNWFIEASS